MPKAIIIKRHGGPEVLEYGDVDVVSPGPGEVRLRQKAVGVNFIDVYQRFGGYAGSNPDLPFIPGSEASGDVVEVGEGVTSLKPGDRVAYGTVIGAYTQERIVAADKLVKLDEEISYETGAAMMLKGLTAQYLLRRTHHVAPGDVILVHAAAGGVGQILCQWGSALGATVIGTVGSAEKAKIASDNGADHVILYRTEDFVAKVKEITKGKLCDVVYDGVGKATFPGSLDCIRPFGLFASFGSASGTIDAFNLSMLSSRGSLFATRPTLFTHAAKRENLVAMAKDLSEAIASGHVRFNIGEKIPLAEAARAHELLEARTTVGSTILVP